MVAEQRKFVEGIGQIPSAWEVKSADEVSLKITKGTTPPKADIVNHQKIPFLRVNNLGFNGSIDKKSDFIFVSRSAHEGFLARSRAYPGDILINIVGPPLGKVSLLGDEFSEYNMNQAIVIYRLVDDVIHRDFFVAYLLSDTAQQWLQSRSKKTSGQQNLTIETCKGLPVPVPALDEQKKIAQILSTWDKAITTTEQLLANSQQQKTALMQQLLTGKRRLLDKNGVRFSGEWLTDALKNIVGKIYGGGTPSRDNPDYWGGSIPWITVKDLICSRIDGAQEYITDRGLKESSANMVPSGTVIICTRMAVGKTVVASVDAAINQDLKAISPSENVCSEYLFYWFTYHTQMIEKMGTGSTVKGVQIDAIKALKMSVPRTLNEQQKIAAAMSTADQEITALQQNLAALKQEKKALMQQLLTGKRRVPLN